MRRIVKEWKNKSDEQMAGLIAEAYFVTSFNEDAAGKRSPVRARRTATNGRPFDAADIEIRDRRGQPFEKVQVKFHGSPEATASAISKSKFNGMQKVVPADQVDRVRNIASERGNDGLGGRNYDDTAKTVSDRVRAAGVESGSLSRGQALDLTRRKRRKNANSSAKRAERGPLTRDGFEHILVKHVSAASTTIAPLTKKRVSPRDLRHSCAMNGGDTRHSKGRPLARARLRPDDGDYMRADPTAKLEAIDAVVPPALRRGPFRALDRLIALLKP